MAQLMEDEVFMAFTTYAAIVTVKMMLMGPLTAYYRITRGVGNNGNASNVCFTEVRYNFIYTFWTYLNLAPVNFKSSNT